MKMNSDKHKNHVQRRDLNEYQPQSKPRFNQLHLPGARVESSPALSTYGGGWRGKAALPTTPKPQRDPKLHHRDSANPFRRLSKRV